MIFITIQASTEKSLKIGMKERKKSMDTTAGRYSVNGLGCMD